MNDTYKGIVIFICKISGYTLYFWTVIFIFGAYICWTRFSIALAVFISSLSILKINKIITNKIK